MARRLLLVAVIAVLTAALPASSYAATAPAAAPTLTTAPYVKPATFTWTSAPVDLLDPAHNVSQQVYRANGVCPASTANTGGAIGNALDPTGTQTHTTADTIADGTYCFHIRTTDVLGGTADGPGLTLMLDTIAPTGTVAVAPVSSGNVVTGTVNVSGTSADAVSGVDSSTFHVGPANACPSGAVVAPSWDTTTVANGTYAVCNVVIDKAGHLAVFSTTVTVANAAPTVPIPDPVPVDPTGSIIPPVTPPVIQNPGGKDPTAPHAPTKLKVTLPRSKLSTGTLAVRLSWVKPTAPDLARVVVVLNLKRAPKSPADGTKVYKGLGTSTSLRLKAGATGYVALFAYDTSGNISSPARKVVSLAPLIPLRPTTGSSVTTSPRLTWTATKGTAYYNVQLFHNGSRVLTGWPTTAAFSIPPGKLEPGTYVWFVWPAVKHGTGDPTFGKLIGRATFVYKGL
jgi:hypothetical protein